MKRTPLIYPLLIGILCNPCFVGAYERETHADISRAAANASVLADNSYFGVLSGLGLNYPIADGVNQLFPNSNNVKKSILELIRDGARFEDDGTKPGNHFYNSITGQGLSILGFNGNPSPDWALEDKAVIAGQDFSYKDARQYFYDALTKGSRQDRDQNFGLTFQTLGQVIHHIQDMAQPQHVRNDPHCDLVFPCLVPGGLFGLYAPSLYEKYTDLDQVRATLPFSGYSPVFAETGDGYKTQVGGNIFRSPRNFWRTSSEGQSDISQGKGIAEFTNRNFVSAGTNFDTTLFASPVSLLGPPSTIPIQTLLQEDGTCPNGSNPACQLNGNVIFSATNVNDSLSGQFVQNNRASTFSIFDQDLKQYNAIDPVTGQPMSAYTLNRFNFRAAYPFLIPKAVAYSAGLINYFFRGHIDFIRPDFSISNQYKIRNLSAEELEGTFEIYYDGADGTRYPVPEMTWTGIIPVFGTSPVITMSPTTELNPMPYTFYIVFRGRMGQEPDAVVAQTTFLGRYVLWFEFLSALQVDGRGHSVWAESCWFDLYLPVGTSTPDSYTYWERFGHAGYQTPASRSGPPWDGPPWDPNINWVPGEPAFPEHANGFIDPSERCNLKGCCVDAYDAQAYLFRHWGRGFGGRFFNRWFP